ncbi:hypothetical protein CH330_01470 [candidate division WOR-3 bacterium JGI_Cruoil_03_51_56]|uniref:Uncharacterized protein n=1 Tax=candidate division WOR-3 bacterium JGI_Cruoil_03_51_56 TaxID=1973747 RepID=A0A235BXN5_UNCW3|nr:MAG: hypothetical protein CH330_01470 [candidate division WOR-3 bacterium JGI_Cruoil_03_51_56]
MSEEIEKLRKEVAELKIELADVKARCVLKEPETTEASIGPPIPVETQEEAEETDSETESTTSEEPTA